MKRYIIFCYMVLAMVPLEGRCAPKSQVRQGNKRQGRQGFAVVSQQVLIAGIINAIVQARNQGLDREIGAEIGRGIDEAFANIFTTVANN